METAEILISRFGPVLAAAVEPPTPDRPTVTGSSGAPDTPLDPADLSGDEVPPADVLHPEVLHPEVLHAEVLHQLCTADGLLELLDWSRQGLGADPLACMWLGSLRWYRLITGSYPENAPQPPARPLDQQLQRLGSDGGWRTLRDSASTSLRGLSQGQMSYPSSPAQPGTTEASALLRAVPVGLVPYIDPQMRRAWARQTMALTHGHPELTQKAEDLADLVHLLASGPAAEALPASALAQQQEISAGLDQEVAAILDRQLLAAAGAVPASVPAPLATPIPAPSSSPEADTRRVSRRVYDVISELARDWEEVTRAR